MLNPSNLEAAVPLQIVELKPETLHFFWPVIRRGLDHVVRRVKPDWIPENIFTALSTANANCCLPVRDDRVLGFAVYYKQARPFSLRSDLFIWAAWNLPLRERLAKDGMQEVVPFVWNYLEHMRRQWGADEKLWITTPGRAKAFERKYGWKPKWVTVSVK